MGIGLFRLSCHKPFDPLFDLGNVFGFFQALGMSLPGLGKFSPEQIDDVQGEMGSRVLVCAGSRVAGPDQCGLLPAQTKTLDPISL